MSKVAYPKVKRLIRRVDTKHDCSNLLPAIAPPAFRPHPALIPRAAKDTSSEAPKRDSLNQTMEADTSLDSDQAPSDKSAALALILRIPFDILGIIFKCQEEPPRSFRFTVSHVCRIWREHVLAMPFLWNTLCITKRVPCWEMLEAMLERSAQAPLDIYIGQAPFVKSALPNLRKIMRIILPHLGRWRSFHLSNAPHKVRRTLLDQIRAKFAPHLKDIKISQTTRNDGLSRIKFTSSSPKWRAQNVFAGFPNLRSVKWTSHTPCINNLPSFKNLKNLTLGEGTLDYTALQPFIELVHRILSDSPSLETFTINNPPVDPWSGVELVPFQGPILIHSSLQTLSINSGARGFDNSHKFRTATIRSLVLPKLRTFSTKSYGEFVGVSCCDMIAQENSLPELCIISIKEDADFGPWTLTPSLDAYMSFLCPAIQNLANLRVLNFESINFDNGRWLPDLGNCCPHLRCLAFLFCAGVTIPSIRLLVETRIHKDGVNPLEFLFVIAPYDAPPECEPNDEDEAWFSRHLIFGMPDLSWRYDTEPAAQ
ncbi:hypothetical protein FRC01_012811 [Tulasnella sp. 417]|nr:hypothetical protein FRC01_012811 [Tulasnella sp. 417]